MNDEATKFYDHLWKSVADIYSRFLVWKQLFSSDSVVNDLNRTAPEAFTVMFWSIYDSLIMGISRLTDVPRGDNNYFTLRKFCELVDPALGQRINDKLSSHDACFGPIREKRDKQTGHTDKSAFQIPLATTKEVEDAIDALIDLMNYIERELGMTEMSYKGVQMLGDGSVLARLMAEEVQRGARNADGRTDFYRPDHNIDEQLYQQTGLRLDRDKLKQIVFHGPQDERLNSLYELFGLVSEISKS